MNADLRLDSFLERNRIAAGTWEAATIEWAALQEIGRDHDLQHTNLSESAELFARLVQKFDKVHSVRWRVKDTEHLLEKIVRKRAERVGKYLEITPANYFEVVADLVGIRALHLYKEDCIAIDRSIRQAWHLVEQTVAYVREGDPAVFLQQLAELGFDIKNHPAGYRSIHYIVESRPVSRKVTTEIQVRTIFEEGWSEIDHNIRYPNLSDNALVEYFLTIFNRMAGSADEMGAFVRGLASTLQQMEDNIITANAEKEASVRHMEEALSQLESANNRDKVSTSNLQTLKEEVAKLRAEASTSRSASATSNGSKPGLINSSVLAALARFGEPGLINTPDIDALRKTLTATNASVAALKAGGVSSAADAIRKVLDPNSASLAEHMARDVNSAAVAARLGVGEIALSDAIRRAQNGG